MLHIPNDLTYINLLRWGFSSPWTKLIPSLNPCNWGQTFNIGKVFVFKWTHLECSGKTNNDRPVNKPVVVGQSHNEFGLFLKRFWVIAYTLNYHL